MGKLIYFDQKFDCELKHSHFDAEHIVIETQGVWYAKTWQSPEPYSHQLIADLAHTWKLKQANNSFLIVSHICESFSYRQNHSPVDGEL